MNSWLSRSGQTAALLRRSKSNTISTGIEHTYDTQIYTFSTRSRIDWHGLIGLRG